MDRSEEAWSTKEPRFSLSQETITMLTVGVALAGIILVNQGDMRAEARADRAEARADREAMREEARTDRARTDAALNAMRAEGRADRKAFAKQITRLVEQQGTLSGLVEGLQHAIDSSKE